MLSTILQVGKTFTNIESVRSALDRYSVETSSPYKFKTNRPKKLLVVCLMVNISTCPFTISANKRKDGYIYIVKLVQHDENCLTFTQTFKARGSYLTKFSAPLIEDIAALRSHDIVNHIRSEAGVKTSYMAAWRSLIANKKCKAEEIDKGYQYIKPLLDNLLTANLGNIFSFETDAKN
ncbi:10696_t:CDS:1 [Scutellospora calospora]|uniref:10696_t:CDS:1 n=1 Tax=Scutellospora calospora TaxID=85575 RepID=A0ACA9LVD4_9GLOM|nr:10696_t:CDS:1 [Scutellospora calospora]